MSPNARIVITGIFTLVIAVYLMRLFFLQVIDDKYKLSASNNVLRYITEYPARGLVYDRHGRLLVYNEAVYDLMVIPRQVKEIDTAAFCALLGITRDSFLSKMAKAARYSRFKSSLFEKQLSAAAYATLQEKMYRFNGFFVQPRTVRKYPGTMAAHALGYIGEVDDRIIKTDSSYRLGDYLGVSGIERSYENELRGKRGLSIVMVDVFNREKGSFEDGRYDSSSIAGENLTATLDGQLQAFGERLMQNKAGSIVAIEPATGEILAMVTAPAYDPNLLVGRVRTVNYGQLRSDPAKPLFNRAMQAYYPPGSTFKLTGALAALQEGIITPQTSFAHVFAAGRKLIRCHIHPPVALRGAIQYSCNPYFCNVFRSFVDHQKFGSSAQGYATWRSLMAGFGLGQKAGVDLPHELPGLLPQVSYYDGIYGAGRWRGTTIYSLGIGQGELGITPLQMANIICVIANKGYYYTPHIIRAIGGRPNTTRSLSEKHLSPIETIHFEEVIAGMQAVVEGGTARNARFGDVVVCGKTGTAQNPHGKDHSLFVAFAPREDPRIAIAVMVENAGFGSTWAVPIASLLMEQYLLDSISRPELETRIADGDLLSDHYLIEKARKPPLPEPAGH